MVTTTSKTKISISLDVPLNWSQAEAEAIVFTKIGYISALGGSIGKDYNIVDWTDLETGLVQKLFGVADNGRLTPEIMFDKDDSGQASMAQAHSDAVEAVFKIEFYNGTTLYLIGLVKKFNITGGDSDTIITRDSEIAIQGKEILVTTA